MFGREFLSIAIGSRSVSAGVRAERGEPLARALRLVGAGVLVHDDLELDDRLRLLAELQVRETLLQVSGGCLVALGVRAKEPVPRGDRLAVLLLGRVALSGPV